MGVRKPKPLFYLVIKDIRTKPKFKSRTLTVYSNGVPGNLNSFKKWLAFLIEKEASIRGRKK